MAYSRPQLLIEVRRPFIIAALEDVRSLVSHFSKNGVACTKHRESGENVLRFPGSDASLVVELFEQWRKQQKATIDLPPGSDTESRSTDK